jgi:uncharacterized protein (TIGR02246 family)
MAKRTTKRTTKRTMKRRARPTARKRAAAGPSPAAAIVRLDQEFMKGVATKDSRALVAAFYAPDAVLLPPGQPAVEGRENIRVALQGMMDTGVTSIKLTTKKVWSTGALAFARATYTLSLTPADGVPVEDTGKSLVCYRRQPNGSWRAILDMFSSDRATR